MYYLLHTILRNYILTKIQKFNSDPQRNYPDIKLLLSGYYGFINKCNKKLLYKKFPELSTYEPRLNLTFCMPASMKPENNTDHNIEIIHKLWFNDFLSCLNKDIESRTKYIYLFLPFMMKKEINNIDEEVKNIINLIKNNTLDIKFNIVETKEQEDIYYDIYLYIIKKGDQSIFFKFKVLNSYRKVIYYSNIVNKIINPYYLIPFEYHCNRYTNIKNKYKKHINSIIITYINNNQFTAADLNNKLATYCNLEENNKIYYNYGKNIYDREYFILYETENESAEVRSNIKQPTFPIDSYYKLLYTKYVLEIGKIMYHYVDLGYDINKVINYLEYLNTILNEDDKKYLQYVKYLKDWFNKIEKTTLNECINIRSLIVHRIESPSIII